MNNYTNPKSELQADREQYWRLHNKVFQHILDEKDLSVDLINEVLEFDDQTVTQDHLDQCQTILDSSVTVHMPYPRSEHVPPFSAVAGPENTNISSKKVPGCYHIHSPSVPGSYIGQAVHLGKRVKDHLDAKSLMSSWIGSMSGDCLVTLYLVPREGILGLSLNQSICLMEQYLFFTIKPTMNKTLVARPGVMHTACSNKKHAEKMNKAVYVYTRDEDNSENLELVHTFPSGRGMTRALGLGKSFTTSVIARGGWFRDTLYFSINELVPNALPTLEFNDFLLLFNELRSTSIRQLDQHNSDGKAYITDTSRDHSKDTLGVKVLATNTVTGSATVFDSIASVAREFGTTTHTIKGRITRKQVVSNIILSYQ